jgi:methionyl-tRNA formyltransferase
MPAFDMIILLTGQVEQPVLTSVLQGHNPLLTIQPVETLTDLAALEPERLQRARLIAFSTGVIVPVKVLDQLGYGAYNFHSGPPEFPGWSPARFAIHRRVTEFGATAHVMAERVDSGPIVGTELFPVPVSITVSALEELTYAHLARLFWRLAESLATQSDPLPMLPLTWSGQKTSRRFYAAMGDIPLNTSK